MIGGAGTTGAGAASTLGAGGLATAPTSELPSPAQSSGDLHGLHSSTSSLQYPSGQSPESLACMAAVAGQYNAATGGGYHGTTSPCLATGYNHGAGYHGYNLDAAGGAALQQEHGAGHMMPGLRGYNNLAMPVPQQSSPAFGHNLHAWLNQASTGNLPQQQPHLTPQVPLPLQPPTFPCPPTQHGPRAATSSGTGGGVHQLPVPVAHGSSACNVTVPNNTGHGGHNFSVQQQNNGVQHMPNAIGGATGQEHHSRPNAFGGTGLGAQQQAEQQYAFGHSLLPPQPPEPPGVGICGSSSASEQQQNQEFYPRRWQHQSLPQQRPGDGSSSGICPTTASGDVRSMAHNQLAAAGPSDSLEEETAAPAFNPPGYLPIGVATASQNHGWSQPDGSSANPFRTKFQIEQEALLRYQNLEEQQVASRTGTSTEAGSSPSSQIVQAQIVHSSTRSQPGTPPPPPPYSPVVAHLPGAAEDEDSSSLLAGNPRTPPTRSSPPTPPGSRPAPPGEAAVSSAPPTPTSATTGSAPGTPGRGETSFGGRSTSAQRRIGPPKRKTLSSWWDDDTPTRAVSSGTSINVHRQVLPSSGASAGTASNAMPPVGPPGPGAGGPSVRTSTLLPSVPPTPSAPSTPLLTPREQSDGGGVVEAPQTTSSARVQQPLTPGGASTVGSGVVSPTPSGLSVQARAAVVQHSVEQESQPHSRTPSVASRVDGLLLVQEQANRHVRPVGRSGTQTPTERKVSSDALLTLDNPREGSERSLSSSGSERGKGKESARSPRFDTDTSSAIPDLLEASLDELETYLPALSKAAPPVLYGVIGAQLQQFHSYDSASHPAANVAAIASAAAAAPPGAGQSGGPPGPFSGNHDIVAEGTGGLASANLLGLSSESVGGGDHGMEALHGSNTRTGAAGHGQKRGEIGSEDVERHDLATDDDQHSSEDELLRGLPGTRRTSSASDQTVSPAIYHAFIAGGPNSPGELPRQLQDRPLPPRGTIYYSVETEPHSTSAQHLPASETGEKDPTGDDHRRPPFDECDPYGLVTEETDDGEGGEEEEDDAHGSDHHEQRGEETRVQQNEQQKRSLLITGFDELDDEFYEEDYKAGAGDDGRPSRGDGHAARNQVETGRTTFTWHDTQQPHEVDFLEDSQSDRELARQMGGNPASKRAQTVATRGRARPAYEGEEERHADEEDDDYATIGGAISDEALQTYYRDAVKNYVQPTLLQEVQGPAEGEHCLQHTGGATRSRGGNKRRQRDSSTFDDDLLSGEARQGTGHQYQEDEQEEHESHKGEAEDHEELGASLGVGYQDAYSPVYESDGEEGHPGARGNSDNHQRVDENVYFTAFQTGGDGVEQQPPFFGQQPEVIKKQHEAGALTENEHEVEQQEEEAEEDDGEDDLSSEDSSY
ncbi:unnamed protein product [Amoebophrya sp. A25]|nr:unnamed protein product [Amoebophrya sp. A25]|eukprot:GSA25T00018840001.1